MFRFTVTMMISDIQRVFRGFLILLYLGLLGFVLGLPFYMDNAYSTLYASVVLLSFVIPQLPKLFYVLPFGEKLIRRYLHLRCILTALLFIAIGGIIMLISIVYPSPHLKQGWSFVTLYAQLCLLSGLIHCKANKRTSILFVTLSTLLTSGNLLNIFLSRSLKPHLMISLCLLIATELLLSFGLKTYKLGNYVEPMNGLYRNQRIKSGGGKTT